MSCDGSRALDDFDQAWAQARHIRGWLTREQAEVLWSAVVDLRPGARVVEIGSHHGRSTVVLGRAARSIGARVVAVDPFVAGGMFGGRASRESFVDNIAAAGLDGTVRLVEEYSTELRPSWHEPIDLLYVDGKHDCRTLRDDLRWTRYLEVGADFLVHDAFSSVGVTVGVVSSALITTGYRYVGRTGSLARFRMARPSASDRGRLFGQLPWFVRNLTLKALLRLRLSSVAARFGHRGPFDPY